MLMALGILFEYNFDFAFSTFNFLLSVYVVATLLAMVGAGCELRTKETLECCHNYAKKSREYTSERPLSMQVARTQILPHTGKML